MRMRKKPNLEPRMAACAAWQVSDAAAMSGRWRSLKPGCAALWVEVGCGKGKFTVETARANPDVLLIAIERCREAMVMAMEKARDMGLTNVFFVDMDVALMERCFAPGEIDRLFINFPDPWPRSKNAKRRLTHRSFLRMYTRVIRDGGEIHFKTDNAKLFEFTLEELQALELPTRAVTRDLHAGGPVGIMTGYEEKFYALGTPINRCEILCHPIAEPSAPAEEPSAPQAEPDV